MSSQSNKFSRRDFLKTTVSGTAVSVAAGGFFITGTARAQPQATLNMLAWYGHAEPDIVAEFEARNNCKIKPKYYTGGDNMLALIAQSPIGTYDLILSDAEYVPQLQKAGYIEKLNPKDYPFDDFFPEFQKFPGHWQGGELYSLITRFGFLGVSYNTEAVSEKKARSYKVFWDPAYKGKVGHFDWYLPNMGQISLLNGSRAPFDLSGNEFAKLKSVLTTLRPQAAGFFDYGGTFSGLKSGQLQLVGGIGDWITGVLKKSGAKVDSVVPDEGGLQWTESFCIGKNSRNHELSKKFLQYISSPKGQSKSARMVAYPAMVPNKKGWELLNREDPAEAKRQGMVLSGKSCIDDIRSGKIKFRELPRRQNIEDWNDFWSDYKNA
ncbi:MAG: spermidine/putrescine ABC transporter substrate-binding protein [Telluria sp.]|nr:spermidine/putrescine ABC transporter substrate-binding protein [Telluria sp.]